MRRDRLQDLMNRRGINPAALAELVGRSERNMWRILSTEGNTSDETVVAIAQALEVSADYLLGLSEDPSPHMRIDNLSEQERAILAAIRRGDKLKAINIISAAEN